MASLREQSYISAMTIVLDRAQPRHPETAHRPDAPVLRKPGAAGAFEFAKAAPRIGLGLLAVAALSAGPALAQSAPQDAAQSPVTITNLMSGVACGPPDNRQICFQTSDIQVTDEGRCQFNQGVIACTWFGYAFDYHVETGGATLQCDWQGDVPGRFGNPNAELESNATHATYTIDLQQGDHHFFNQQYVTAVPGGQTETVTQTCSYEGRALFNVVFRFHQPERKFAP